jgi:hypothetical protein
VKRALVVLGISFVTLFAVITAVKQYSGRGETSDDVEESERRKAIRTFWDHYNTATTARGAGDFDQAVLSYRAALEMNPGHEESLFYLAVCLQEQGQYPEAVDTLRRLTEIYPTSNRGLAQLGVLLSTMAPGAEPAFDEAYAALERCKQINYEQTGPFIREGLLEINRGDLEKARDVLAAPAQAGAPEGVYLAGLTEYLKGDLASASKMFVRVLDSLAREQQVSKRGVTSEGDVQSDYALTPLERAAVKSRFFLYWTASRMNGYPDAVPEPHRIDLSDSKTSVSFVTESLPGAPRGRGLWIDIDRDGREEILIAGENRVAVYRQTSGAWADVSREIGLGGTAGAWDATSIDDDGDGWPDLYLVRKGFMGEGQNSLLRNRGGRFQEVTEEVGLAGERATARALSVDLTGDERADILEVGNQGSSAPVRVYVQENGRFQERARDIGLSFSGNAVDAAVADFDGNGRADVFILGWKRPGRLFLNTPDGFVDQTDEAGLQGVGGAGFSVVVLDYDRDGWQDLLVTARAPLELSLNRMLNASRSDRSTPRLFRNREGRFEDVTARVDLNHHYGTMQAIPADLDGDGWTDVAFAHGGLERQHLEPSLVLRNDGGRKFVEWIYLPSPSRPLNAVGVTVSAKGTLFLSGLGVVRYEDS